MPLYTPFSEALNVMMQSLLIAPCKTRATQAETESECGRSSYKAETNNIANIAGGQDWSLLVSLILPPFIRRHARSLHPITLVLGHRV